MIKLFFAGDIVCNINRNSLLSPELKKILLQKDICCCNFEAPIQIAEKHKANKIGPTLCQTKDIVNILKKDGFNLFNIANNHIMDYGVEGLRKTIKLFGDFPIIGAGFTENEIYKAYIYEKENIKIAFLSVAENGFGCANEKNDIGYAWILHKKVKENIIKLKKQVDYIIINCHAGAELFEYPLPEIRELYKSFIECGADVIIGHHPHIIQGYEKYNNGLIFYSLGNFAFENSKKEILKKSLGIELYFDNKKINHNVIQLYYNNEYVDIDKREDSKKHFEDITNNLLSENYMSYVDDFCINIYNKRYKPYYNVVSSVSNENYKNRIKTAIKLILKKDRFNDLFLYHNIAIETHRWICQRAIKKLNSITFRSDQNEN